MSYSSTHYLLNYQSKKRLQFLSPLCARKKHPQKLYDRHVMHHPYTRGWNPLLPLARPAVNPYGRTVPQDAFFVLIYSCWAEGESRRGGAGGCPREKQTMKRETGRAISPVVCGVCWLNIVCSLCRADGSDRGSLVRFAVLTPPLSDSPL